MNTLSFISTVIPVFKVSFDLCIDFFFSFSLVCASVSHFRGVLEIPGNHIYWPCLYLRLGYWNWWKLCFLLMVMRWFGQFVFCLLSHYCTHLGFIFLHSDSTIFENFIAIYHLYLSSLPLFWEFLSLKIPLLLFGGVWVGARDSCESQHNENLIAKQIAVRVYPQSGKLDFLKLVHCVPGVQAIEGSESWFGGTNTPTMEGGPI